MSILRRHVALLLASCLVVAWSFPIPRLNTLAKERNNPLGSKSFGPEEEFDDGIGGTTGGSDVNTEGEKLAKEFFRQQREREKRTSGLSDYGEDISNLKAGTNTVPDETARPFDMNRGLFDEPARDSEQSSSASRDLPRRKFTGRRDDFAPQVFSSRTGAGQARSPREVMMQREYELVGRAERGLGVQAIFAVLALAFYIYIGATGGIVTGEEAMADDFGFDDTIPFEETMPVQRDSETSVWL